MHTWSLYIFLMRLVRFEYKIEIVPQLFQITQLHILHVQQVGAGVLEAGGRPVKQLGNIFQTNSNLT